MYLDDIYTYIRVCVFFICNTVHHLSSYIIYLPVFVVVVWFGMLGFPHLDDTSGPAATTLAATNCIYTWVYMKMGYTGPVHPQNGVCSCGK